MRVMPLRAIPPKLIDQVEIIVQVRVAYLPVASQPGRVNFPVDLAWRFAAILHQSHVIRLECNDVRPSAQMGDGTVKPLVFNRAGQNRSTGV